MKLYAPLFAVLLAAPALAQTEADGNAGNAIDSEGLSSRSGAAFYSDDGMVTLRSAEEAKAGWSSLTPEDQQALRDQCANLPTEGAQTAENTAPADTTSTPSPQPTEGAQTEETTAPADTTSTPSPQPTEGAETAENSTPMATNFVADPVRLRAVCDRIGGF